jgi:hypothetical protein
MKRENTTASSLMHFANASILKSAVVAVVEIPGAYPGHPSRRRIVTHGSFPIDVTESVEDVLVRWKGDIGAEEARRHALEARVAELETLLKRLKIIQDAEQLMKEVQCIPTN